MFRTFTALVVAIPLMTPVLADDPKEKPSEITEKFEELQKDYREARDAYEKLVKAGKDVEAANALERNNPASYLPKMLELAFFHPSDPAALDVLVYLMAHGSSDSYLWDQVMLQLRNNQAANPKMKHVVRLLTVHDDETAAVLRELIAKNPDKKVVAYAARLLLDYVGGLAKIAEEMNDKQYLKALLERRVGESYLKRVLADMDKNKKEAKELTDLIADKYKDVLPDLAIGQPLPGLVVEDLVGTKVKLNDQAGKVVVLCVFCTSDEQVEKIASRQQTLAKQFAGKPFVQINVFVDDKKDTVTEYLKKNPLPATNCWAGAKANLLEEWELPQTPVTFVLDAKGVLRARAVTYDMLQDLVKEAEQK
jgi:peroxiredoxin